MTQADLLQKLQEKTFTPNQILVHDFIEQILSLEFIDFLETKKIYGKTYYTVSAKNSKNLYKIVVLPTYQTMEYAVLKIEDIVNSDLFVEFTPHLEDDMIYETYKLKFDDLYANYFERKLAEDNVNNLYNFLEQHLTDLCSKNSLEIRKTEKSLKVFADSDVYLNFDFSRPSVLSINFEKLSKKLAFQTIMYRNLKKLDTYYTFLEYIEDAIDNLKIYKETGNILLLDKKTTLNEFLDVFESRNLYPNVDYLPFKLSAVVNLGSKSKYAIFSNLQYLYGNIKINFELCLDGEIYLLKTHINTLSYENIFTEIFEALEYIYQIKTILENTKE